MGGKETRQRQPETSPELPRLCDIFITGGVREAQSIVKDASPRTVLTAAFWKMLIPSQALAGFRDGCFPPVVGMMNSFTQISTRGHLDGPEDFTEEVLVF